MPELKNSSRIALKATYVLHANDRQSAQAPLVQQSPEPSVFAKAQFVHSLRLSSRELGLVPDQLGVDDRETLCQIPARK
jgi:hypothetical protein